MPRPSFVEPMTARVVTSLPEGGEWSYEVKLDGYRALVVKDGDRIQLRSRTGKDLTRTYQPVATAASRLRTAQAVLDGEIVAIDASGRPSFQALQVRFVEWTAEGHLRHAAFLGLRTDRPARAVRRET